MFKGCFKLSINLIWQRMISWCSNYRKDKNFKTYQTDLIQIYDSDLLKNDEELRTP